MHEVVSHLPKAAGKACIAFHDFHPAVYSGHGLTEADGESGYGSTKHLAERLVSAARFCGVRASTYRLSFVAASNRTGHFRLDRGGFLNNLISGSVDLGAFPAINADLYSVLPVNSICRTIATVLEGEDAMETWQDYDFVHFQLPIFSRFFKDMAAASDCKADIPFGEWRQLALNHTAVHPKSVLACIATIIDGHTEQTVGFLMKSGPIGKHTLSSEGSLGPLIDRAHAERHVERLRRA